MKFLILPYNKFSKSSIALCKELDCKILIPEKDYSNEIKKEGFIIINWGCYNTNSYRYADNGFITINNPYHIHELGKEDIFYLNKNEIKFSHCFSDLKNTSIIGYVKKGRSNNPVVFEKDDDKNCYLFSEYISHSDEFVIHVLNKKIIAYERRRLVKYDEEGKAVNKEDVEWKIRTPENGFELEEVQEELVPITVIEEAKDFSEKLESDFFSINIIYSKKKNKSWIIGINYNPWIFDKKNIIKSYANGFREMLYQKGFEKLGLDKIK